MTLYTYGLKNIKFTFILIRALATIYPLNLLQVISVAGHIISFILMVTFTQFLFFSSGAISIFRHGRFEARKRFLETKLVGS